MIEKMLGTFPEREINRELVVTRITVLQPCYLLQMNPVIF